MGLSKTITQKNLKRQNIGCKSRKDAKGLPFALLLSLKLHIHKPTELFLLIFSVWCPLLFVLGARVNRAVGDVEHSVTHTAAVTAQHIIQKVLANPRLM